MQNEIMRMVLEQLIEYRDSTEDDRFDDSIDALETLLKKPKKPMSSEEARDIYKQLPNDELRRSPRYLQAASQRLATPRFRALGREISWHQIVTPLSGSDSLRS